MKLCVPSGGGANLRKSSLRWTLRGAGYWIIWAWVAVAGEPAGRGNLLIDADFAKGGFSELGWKASGAWKIVTYPAPKNDPGPVARYAAREPEGMLSKDFEELKNPKSLELTLEAGFGWGAADHAEGASFMLLDAAGNGYLFATQRARGKWAVQWALVTNGKAPKDRRWAAQEIDATQAAIRDGGGMERLKVTRDVEGNWTFSCATWNQGAGGEVKFADTTTTHFARLVLVGSQNVDEIAFNKVRLEGEQGGDYAQGQVAIIQPKVGADVRGVTAIEFAAPGCQKVTVKCWKQGESGGTDAEVGSATPDQRGGGKVIFPAEEFPHGPITLRISGESGRGTDTFCLQLYNQGGVSWQEGVPKESPPAAREMRLVFADDFTGPLSISSDNANATYYDHKPPDGSQDFSTLPFTSFDRPNNPFAQVDTYLRIRASERAKSAGLISSLKRDGSGITAKAPCYFECRFIGPNAIGTWPAFWLLTAPTAGDDRGDELDIIEAYGGEGPRSPNAHDSYMITPHAWNQGTEGKKLENRAFQAMHNPCQMGKFGIRSSWYEAPHTYGCKVTAVETIYYCDNIEVGRHPSLPLSTERPLYFLINLATGGGWPVNLSRYEGQADMYVDYVRVYEGVR